MKTTILKQFNDFIDFQKLLSISPPIQKLSKKQEKLFNRLKSRSLPLGVKNFIPTHAGAVGDVRTGEPRGKVLRQNLRKLMI